MRGPAHYEGCADYFQRNGAGQEYPLAPLPYLCGWRWDTEDENNNSQTQVGIHDVEDVIRWIKDTDGWQNEEDLEDWEPVESHYDNWDGENIFLLGASSGGNFVSSVAANSASDPDIRPTAAAILSGFPHTGRTANQDQDWSCDSGSSNTPECWRHLNNYLNCSVNGEFPTEAVQSCKGQFGRYEMASPKNGAWSYPDTPPMFIANAGYGVDHTDLSPLQLAEDFFDHLKGQGGYDDTEIPPNIKLCQVNSSGHATGYLDNSIRQCEGDEMLEVIESLVEFFGGFD